MVNYKYHHLGIPTKTPVPGEKYLEGYDIWHCGYEESAYGIEWMRYGNDCSLPEIVKTTPHVAFIEENGAPIEFIQILSKPLK
jgi:hypothetical protein